MARAAGERPGSLASFLCPSRETPLGLFLHVTRASTHNGDGKAAAGGESLALSGDYSYATADCRELHITQSVRLYEVPSTFLYKVARQHYSI